jgi:hypothetical protein
MIDSGKFLSLSTPFIDSRSHKFQEFDDFQEQSKISRDRLQQPSPFQIKNSDN